MYQSLILRIFKNSFAISTISSYGMNLNPRISKIQFSVSILSFSLFSQSKSIVFLSCIQTVIKQHQAHLETYGTGFTHSIFIKRLPRLLRVYIKFLVLVALFTLMRQVPSSILEFLNTNMGRQVLFDSYSIPSNSPFFFSRRIRGAISSKIRITSIAATGIQYLTNTWKSVFKPPRPLTTPPQQSYASGVVTH